MIRRQLLLFLLIATLSVIHSGRIFCQSGYGDPTEVVVVSALHQIHEEVDYYSFTDLQNIVETLQPTILALELTQGDLEARKEQKVKLEYQRAIFPLLDEHGYKAVAMEPPEPLYSELVSQHRESMKEAQNSDSVKVAAFVEYTSNLIELFKRLWDSPASVNSAYTDKIFEAKHILQDRIFGVKAAEVWHKWNMHFLDVIRAAAREEQAARIVVIVGAEHSYWLKEKLKAEPGLELLDTVELLTP